MPTYRFTSITTFLIAAFAQTATAQELTYLQGGLAYQDGNNPFGDAQVGVLGLTGEYNTGPAFFSGELTVENSQSALVEDTSTELTLMAGYRIEPDLIVLVGIDYENSDLMGEADVGYSLGMEYDVGAATFGVNARSETEGSNRNDIYAGLQVSDATEIGFRIQNSTLSNEPGYEVTLQHERGPLSLSGSWIEAEDTIAIGGQTIYEVTDSIRVFGSVFRLNGGTFELNAYELGGGYQVVDNLWIDASYVEVESGGGAFDGITLTAVFETGRRTLLRDRIIDTRAEATGFDSLF